MCTGYLLPILGGIFHGHCGLAQPSGNSVSGIGDASGLSQSLQCFAWAALHSFVWIPKKTADGSKLRSSRQRLSDRRSLCRSNKANGYGNQSSLIFGFICSSVCLAKHDAAYSSRIVAGAHDRLFPVARVCCRHRPTASQPVMSLCSSSRYSFRSQGHKEVIELLLPNRSSSGQSSFPHTSRICLRPNSSGSEHMIFVQQ